MAGYFGRGRPITGINTYTKTQSDDRFRDSISGDMLPDSDSIRDIGSTSKRWAQGWFDDVTADTADINGGTIDGTVIGGSTPAAISGTTGSFSGNLTVDTNTLFVDAANNRVGIGTSSPGATLDVQSSDTIVSEFNGTNASNTAEIIIRSNGGVGNNTRGRIIGGYEAGGSNYGGFLAFNTTTTSNVNTERMRIDSSGNVLCGSDGGGDIGSSTKRFKDLYLSGGVYLGGTGAANYLDDYEEGTWTPTVTPGAGIGTYTVGGNYRKIGDVVIVSCSVSINTAGTASGAMTVGNLPFNPATVGSFFQPATIIRESGATGASFRASASAGLSSVRVSTTADGAITWTAGYTYSWTLTYPV